MNRTLRHPKGWPKRQAGTILLTFLALAAFAANSLLARSALGSGQIDATTFTGLRLLAGAVVLALIACLRARSWSPLARSDVPGAFTLFLYAAPFSLAYLRLGAATGALVLFGVVQVTMISAGVLRGERPSRRTTVGLLLAVSGLAMLMLPSAERPELRGLLLMTLAGLSWALYSLLGRRSSEPLEANARSFLWSLLPAAALALAKQGSLHASLRGIALALVCGGVTSGLGYAIWYRALPRLSVTQAAIAQLSVPVLAALAASTLLDEAWTTRLVLSTGVVLTGVALALWPRSQHSGS